LVRPAIQVYGTGVKVMKRIVMFSGGAASWAAARRVVERYGADDVTLLFTDTLMEDEDLYRFLVDGADNIRAIDPAALAYLRALAAEILPVEVGLEARRPAIHALARAANECIPHLVWLYGDDDPWSVFESERFIGNSRIDPCSKILKRQRSSRWRDANCTPEGAVIYIGYDWTEVNRLAKLQTHVFPWHYEAPLMEEPLLSKREILAWLRIEGVAPPRMYAEGYAHANCGGGCVKAGQAQWRLLLKTRPERYAYFERREREVREKIGQGAVLKMRAGGESRPMTLEEFRLRCEGGWMPDLTDWGGCGCALDFEPKGGRDEETEEAQEEEVTTG
jgi:hypothetical protein